MSELLQIAFSGEGAVILKIIGIGVGLWIGTAILNALGLGRFSKLAYTIAVFVCIGMAIVAISNVVSKIM